jgi:hypothetical protein
MGKSSSQRVACLGILYDRLEQSPPGLRILEVHVIARIWQASSPKQPFDFDALFLHTIRIGDIPRRLVSEQAVVANQNGVKQFGVIGQLLRQVPSV